MSHPQNMMLVLLEVFFKIFDKQHMSFNYPSVGEAILRACEPEPRAVSLCLRASKDSRQKMQKWA